MNFSSARSLTLTLTLALHGIATLCGPALHRHDRDEGLLRKKLPTDRLPSASLDWSRADCQVCLFLSLGQIGTERARIDPSGCVVDLAFRFEFRPVSPRPASSARPRAPPRV